MNDRRVVRIRRHSSHSVLLAEQHIQMALAVADHIYIISKGTVVFEGSPEEIKANRDACNKFLGV